MFLSYIKSCIADESFQIHFMLKSIGYSTLHARPVFHYKWPWLNIHRVVHCVNWATYVSKNTARIKRNYTQPYFVSSNVNCHLYNFFTNSYIMVLPWYPLYYLPKLVPRGERSGNSRGLIPGPISKHWCVLSSAELALEIYQ